MSADPCGSLAADLPTLFSCEQRGDHVRIRTPFLYPDGDVIDLYYSDRSGTPTLSDAGETVRWLRMQTTAVKRSPKQTALLHDLCLNHGVEFFRGMLMLRITPRVRLADAVARLGQACVRASDLWFTMRTRAVESMVDEVRDFLVEQEIDHERDVRYPGRSGRDWTLDFHTRTANRSALVRVLSSASRAAARRETNEAVTAWFDLSHLRLAPQLVSLVTLVDDTADVWSEEDFKLLEPLSAVTRWSRPDEFAAILRYAN